RDFLFCSDEVVYAQRQPFLSKNTKKDKHQIDVCLQSESLIIMIGLFLIVILWCKLQKTTRLNGGR
ncbi:hypothetical protein, partial [Streptococcus dysgalactiae]|uniref:hypothetical protein n=1 Tax=Streptococcus dysgalactiae TaxID=1334 RepID=UPI003F773612